MSEEPGISLHFKKILLKECLPPLETPPLSFIPLLSPIENPPNKRQDPTDNMSHVMTTRNIVLHSPFFYPKTPSLLCTPNNKPLLSPFSVLKKIYV